MFKRRLLKIYYLIALLIFAANSVYLVKSDLFFNIEDLPEGNYVYSVNSPDNSCKADVYLIDNKIGSAIRISTTDLVNKKTRNVYWQTDIKNVNIQWHGNSELIIDDLPINIDQGGYYDCRRGKSIILAGSLYSESEKSD